VTRLGGVMKTWCLTSLALVATIALNAQDKIKWISWEEAVELNQHEPRKVIVDVYTDWCGWCKKMDMATFQHPDVVQYVNEHYYAIKFDAEFKGDIEIKDHVYQYVKQSPRGYHQLAAEIIFGRLSFPTIVFMDESLDVIQPIPGFKNHQDFEMIMRYFADDYHKPTPWKKFATSYSRNRP